jgi:Lon protease-like protein
MDHGSSCPLCKSSLVDYLADRRQVTTRSIIDILEQYFPDEFVERQKHFDNEMSELARMGTDSQYEIPIFVCTTAFPTIRCPLHIFEPKYRLMIRRCMESGSRQFGMCVRFDGSTNEEDYSDYGCMLEIRDVQFFPDGRSVVDTVGGKRFKIVSRGQLDGYFTAKVEYLTEIEPATEQEKQEVETLSGEVYSEARDWFSKHCTEMMTARIRQRFGDFPEASAVHGPWTWWLTAVLPLQPKAQVSIMSMRSCKQRLLALRRVLNYVKRTPNL